MVKVYVAAVDPLMQTEYYEEKLALVSEDRRKKVELCKGQKDKVRSLAAELLLLSVWRESHDGDVKMEIGITQNGKPICISDEFFHFNLSHSGRFVALCVAGLPVGIDIQKVKKVDLAIAKRFFMKEEYEIINRKATEEQTELFVKYWTGKESYIKYTGEGLARPINSFYVDPVKNYILDPKTKERTFVRWFTEIPDYQVAVCCAEESFAKSLIEVYL